MPTNKAKIKKKADERTLLIKSAKLATIRARKESIALNLPVQIISKGELVEKKPDGKIRVIKKVEKTKSIRTGLKKGTTICLKRND